MPSQPTLPPLLTPYLSPTTQSPQSLTLITTVLAATSNWLVLRYLVSILSSADKTRDSHSDEDNSGAEPTTRKIVLVSFLRNWDFWRAEAKRLVYFSSNSLCFFVFKTVELTSFLIESGTRFAEISGQRESQVRGRFDWALQQSSDYTKR
jgi:hypothetical protein